jgi:two-component system chemotaxis response regulator CheY
MTNVLIVDDSATMRMIVIKSLRQAGFEKELIPVEAASAREALQKIAQGGIGLVLSDVNMPEITGIELVKVIRAKFKTLPIIMVTTESSPEMRDQMMQAGANGIIVKPFSTDALAKVIREHIK